MDRGDTDLPLEELLAQQEFLIALARRLAGEGEGAEDLVQDAYLAYLRGPRPSRGHLRGWLATVMRNTWRNLRRREAERPGREARAARRERVEGGALPEEEVQRQLELRQRLLEALRSLPEPYLGTIYLRYYEGCSIDEVARRTGAPPETARSRLQRGTELLRAKLDRDFGSRDSWVLALGAWIPPSEGAALASGASAPASAGLQGLWLWIPAGAAAVLVMSVVWVARRSAEVPQDPAVRIGDARPAPRSDAPSAALAGIDPSAARDSRQDQGAAPASGQGGGVGAHVATASRPPNSHELRVLSIAGRVLGPNGLPVDGAWVSHGGKGVAADSEGRFELQLDLITLHRGGELILDPAALVAHAPGLLPAIVPHFASTLPPAPASPYPVELGLGGPALTIEGRVVTRSGVPRPGWRVALRDPTLGVTTGSGWPVGLEDLIGGRKNIRDVDAEGRFRFEGLLERAYEVVAWDPGTVQMAVAPKVAAGIDGLELLAPEPHELRRLSGRVVSLAGAPLANAVVAAGFQLIDVEGHMPGYFNEGGRASTDPDGYFELEVGRDPSLLLFVTSSERIHFIEGHPIPPVAEGLERPFDLTVPVRCELVLEARSAVLPAGRLAVLDEAGNRLPIELSEEEASSLGGMRIWYALILRPGPGRRTVWIREDARFARFHDPGGEEIELRPIRPSAGAATVLTW